MYIRFAINSDEDFKKLKIVADRINYYFSYTDGSPATLCTINTSLKIVTIWKASKLGRLYKFAYKITTVEQIIADIVGSILHGCELKQN